MIFVHGFAPEREGRHGHRNCLPVSKPNCWSGPTPVTFSPAGAAGKASTQGRHTFTHMVQQTSNTPHSRRNYIAKHRQACAGFRSPPMIEAKKPSCAVRPTKTCSAHHTFSAPSFWHPSLQAKGRLGMPQNFANNSLTEKSLAYLVLL